MGPEPELFSGRPCDLSGCAQSANASMSFAHGFSRTCEQRRRRCGKSDWTSTSSSARWRSLRGPSFARRGGSRRSRRSSSCSPGASAQDDRVALEVTGNAWEIKRLLEPHVAEVIVVSPGDTAIRSARAKTDRLDARALAKLLAAGELDHGLGPRPNEPR